MQVSVPSGSGSPSHCVPRKREGEERLGCGRVGTRVHCGAQAAQRGGKSKRPRRHLPVSAPGPDLRTSFSSAPGQASQFGSGHAHLVAAGHPAPVRRPAVVKGFASSIATRFQAARQNRDRTVLRLLLRGCSVPKIGPRPPQCLNFHCSRAERRRCCRASLPTVWVRGGPAKIHWVPSSRHLPSSTENAAARPLPPSSPTTTADRRRTRRFRAGQSSRKPAWVLSRVGDPAAAAAAAARLIQNNASRPTAEASERGTRLALGRRVQPETTAAPARGLFHRGQAQVAVVHAHRAGVRPLQGLSSHRAPVAPTGAVFPREADAGRDAGPQDPLRRPPRGLLPLSQPEPRMLCDGPHHRPHRAARLPPGPGAPEDGHAEPHPRAGKAPRRQGRRGAALAVAAVLPRLPGRRPEGRMVARRLPLGQGRPRPAAHAPGGLLARRRARVAPRRQPPGRLRRLRAPGPGEGHPVVGARHHHRHHGLRRP